MNRRNGLMRSGLLLAVLSIFQMCSADSTGDLDSMVRKLAEQDGRFHSVVADLAELASGDFDVTTSEMIDDIGQNFAQIAIDSPADPTLLEMTASRFVSSTLSGRDTSPAIRLTPDYRTPGFFDKLENTADSIKEKLYEEIMDYSISTGANLFDVDILEGLNVSGAYKYQLNSDYSKGLHTRIDKWRLRIGLAAGTILKDAIGNTLPVYFNITPDREIIFARHFTSKTEALKALPITPISLPLTAEKALKFHPGDFISIPSRMGLNAGLSAGWAHGVFHAGASGGLLLNGEFRINIYRLENSRVRLKISGLRSQGVNGSVSAGYGLSIFGYDPLAHMINIDSVIEKILGTNIFRISASRINGQNLTVDYVFDLKDADARNAYEAILRKTLKFKATDIGKEFIAQNHLDQIVFGDLGPAESLFQADKELPESRQRVYRLFMGSNYYKTNARSFQIGINLLNYNASSSFSQNRVRVIDKNDAPSYYLYPVFTAQSGFSILFGLWKEKETTTAYSFQQSDPEWNPQRLYDTVFNLNSYDKYCRESELKSFIKMVKNNLGSDLSSRTGIHDYKDFKTTKNFTARIKLAINDSGLEAITRSDLDENALYECYIPILESFKYYHNQQSNGDSDFNDNIWIDSKWPKAKKKAAELCNRNWGGEFYWTKVERTIKVIAWMSGKDVFSALEGLRKLYYEEKFYRETIPRLMVNLTTRTSSADNLYTTVQFGGKSISQFYGASGISQYDHIFHNISEILYQISYNSDEMPH
ncbi:MAG: hypothetical protein PHQ23_01555 [Candidatus Wallbacteria bacterium]|nr:hypothetical protein [Candidatus Wallbacteria bacterium]